MANTNKIRTLGMRVLSVMVNEDMSNDLIEFLLEKQPKKYECSGWVIPSKVSLQMFPTDLDNMPKVLELLLAHGMPINYTDILDFIKQSQNELQYNTVECLLKHCSPQQRLKLFEAVVKISSLDRKCDILVEVLHSGTIDNEKFRSMLSKLNKISQCQTFLNQSKGIQNELVQLKLITISESKLLVQ